eukprot:scaffold19141_cov34-Tisochrysis_lutea.AAC.4
MGIASRGALGRSRSFSSLSPELHSGEACSRVASPLILAREVPTGVAQGLARTLHEAVARALSNPNLCTRAAAPFSR